MTKMTYKEPPDSFGSVMTKAEDKIVTDGRTTVKPVSNQHSRSTNFAEC
jgi:hypothetical protein